jgi:hypothetical protein
VAIFLLLTKGNQSLSIVVTVVIICGGFYLTRFTARAVTEWTLTDSDIQLKWLSQFIFHHKADLSINWSEIQEYKYRPDQYFDLFKINLNDGRIIRFRHSSNTSDDFEKFISTFETKVQEYNQKDTVLTNDIKRAKIIYETKLGVVLAILTGLVLIGLPILITTLPHRRTGNWGGLIAAYSGGIFFISQVILYRKKKSSR